MHVVAYFSQFDCLGQSNWLRILRDNQGQQKKARNVFPSEEKGCKLKYGRRMQSTEIINLDSFS